MKKGNNRKTKIPVETTCGCGSARPVPGARSKRVCDIVSNDASLRFVRGASAAYNPAIYSVSRELIWQKNQRSNATTEGQDAVDVRAGGRRTSLGRQNSRPAEAESVGVPPPPRARPVAPPPPPRAPAAPRPRIGRPTAKASTLATADYSYVIRDVKFIAITSAIIILFMVALTFALG